MNESRNKSKAKDSLIRIIAFIALIFLYIGTAKYRFDISGFVSISVVIFAAIANLLSSRKLIIAIAITLLGTCFLLKQVISSPYQSIPEVLPGLLVTAIVAFSMAFSIGIIFNGVELRSRYEA